VSWLEFALGSLVTYRLSLMLSKESGPWRIFKKLRHAAPPKSATREGISCLHCESVWWAAPVTAYLVWSREIAPADGPLYWLGFSAVAIVLHHAFTGDFGPKGK
jgi:hypothetical protein